MRMQPGLAPTGETLLERIGNTPLLRLDVAHQRPAHGSASREGRMVQPRRIDQGPHGRQHRDRSAPLRQACVRERSFSIPPAAIPALPMPCSAPRSASPSRCACRRTFPSNENAFYRHTAQISSTPIPAKAPTAPPRSAHQLAEQHPDLYFYADQYSNDANWRAHYLTTANEIWQQTEGRVTHFVAMMGTTGTFVGTTQAFEGTESSHPLRRASAGLAIPRD